MQINHFVLSVVEGGGGGGVSLTIEPRANSIATSFTVFHRIVCAVIFSIRVSQYFILFYDTFERFKLINYDSIFWDVCYIGVDVS